MAETNHTNRFNLTIRGVDSSGNAYGYVHTAGVLPDSVIPTSFDSNRHTRKIAYRTVNGNYSSRLLSSHRKMIWKYDAIREDEYLKLIENPISSNTASGYGGIYGIQEANNTDLFKITVAAVNESDYCYLKSIFKGCYGDGATFYLGEDTKFEFIGTADGCRYYSGEIHWIEATGHIYEYASQLNNNS